MSVIKLDENKEVKADLLIDLPQDKEVITSN